MVEVCFKVLQSRSQNKVMKVVHLFMFCKLWLCNTANLKKTKQKKKHGRNVCGINQTRVSNYMSLATQHLQ